MLKDCDGAAHVIKYLALGLNKTAVKTAFKNSALAYEMFDAVSELIDNECQTLCRSDSGSVLRCTTPADLVNLKLQDVKNEISLKAPLLTKLLSKICKSKRSKNRPQIKVNDVIVPAVASVILNSRCPEMSAVAYRLGFILRHAGAGMLVRT